MLLIQRIATQQVYDQPLHTGEISLPLFNIVLVLVRTLYVGHERITCNASLLCHLILFFLFAAVVQIWSGSSACMAGISTCGLLS